MVKGKTVVTDPTTNEAESTVTEEDTEAEVAEVVIITTKTRVTTTSKTTGKTPNLMASSSNSQAVVP